MGMGVYTLSIEQTQLKANLLRYASSLKSRRQAGGREAKIPMEADSLPGANQALNGSGLLRGTQKNVRRNFWEYSQKYLLRLPSIIITGRRKLGLNIGISIQIKWETNFQNSNRLWNQWSQFIKFNWNRFKGKAFCLLWKHAYHIETSKGQKYHCKLRG